MALSKPVPAAFPFEIRPSAIHGLGAYATQPIRKGARIGEYVGERISQSEGTGGTTMTPWSTITPFCSPSPPGR